MRDQKKLWFFRRIPIIVAVLLCGYGISLWAEPGAAGRSRGPIAVVDDPKPMDFQKPLDFQVNYLYRPGGQGEPRPIENGTVLQSGDHYKIQFTPKENSYVYIFQLDSTDKIYELFPMERWGNLTLGNQNPVRAGVPYVLPADDKSFVLDEHRGPEFIYFIATREEDPNIGKLADQLREARRRGDPASDKQIQEALAGEIKKRGMAEIVPDPIARVESLWENRESFLLPSQRLDKLCAQCVNAIAFQHQ